MNLKRYNQLFEADIKDNKGVPKDYIDGVEKTGRERFGHTGPSHPEMMEMMGAMQNIMRIQDGKEAELTEIGKGIIMKQYGSILDDVKLDIKIVKPDDEEKMEMVQKMQKPEEDEEEEDDNGIETVEHPDGIEVDVNEVDKRKILNNLMQGEAQNVHSLMFLSKDDIDAVSDRLIPFYTTLLDTNRKFDWFDEANLEEMVKQHPEMANAEEVEWEEDENGETTPVIKVRALDLPMLIHETVKGIYELIMANAIPADETMARKVMDETDTLPNEKEDIKFGPFISADIRDFFTDYIEKNCSSDEKQITSLREFIYGRLAILDADKFVDLIYAILDNNTAKSNVLIKRYKVVSEAILDATDEGEEEASVDYQEEVKAPVEAKEPNYRAMNQHELNRQINAALEKDDFEAIAKIQKYLK